tara:strand:- start:89 stop:637 length:549 start_codon:yes stop_codon:yes gene_type:complete
MINRLLKIFAKSLKNIFGYEALNILLRYLPSEKTVYILKAFGATVGNNVRIKSSLTIHNADQNKNIYSNLIIGNNVYIGRDCIIDLMDKVVIENNVTISHRVVLNTHTDLGESRTLKKKYYPTTVGQITIKKGTYIGSNVTVLENVIIGSNSLIGAFSLVNNDIKSGHRAFGIPCRENKSLN